MREILFRYAKALRDHPFVTAIARSPIEGHLDFVEVDGAETTIAGWFLDRSGGSAPDSLAVFVNGVRVQPVTLVRRRDLPIEKSEAGAVGFVARVPSRRLGRPNDVSVGTPQMPAALRPSRATKIGPPASRGALDVVGPTGVSGWVDVRPAGAPSTPMLIVDATISVPIRASIHRPDVADAGLTDRPDCGFNLRAVELIASMPPDFATHFDFAARHTFELRVGDVVVDRRILPKAIKITGRIERADQAGVEGWAGSKSPSFRVELDMVVDGLFFARTIADRQRDDLRTLRRPGLYCGFSFPVPILSRGETVALTVRSAASGQLLGPPTDLPPRSAPNRGAQVLDHLRYAELPERLCVVVPIHNALSHVTACLDSVIRHTDHPSACLLLLDDNSSDPAMQTTLERYARHTNVTLVRNTTTLGFSGTVNKGIELAGDADIVVLNSDTVVSPRWLQNLQTAAYSDRRIATATPMSDNAGPFSVPEPNRLNAVPDGMDANAYARVLMRESELVFPLVPTGHGFCLYIRRAALRELGDFDAATFPRGYGEETDFCMRAIRSGWQHVVDDRTLVYHRGGSSFGLARVELNRSAQRVITARYPEFERLAWMAFETGAEMATVRFVARRSATRALSNSAGWGQPRILFVLAATSGGTPLTNADLMGELLSTHDVWMLRAHPRSVELIRVEADRQIIHRSHVLAQPVNVVTHRSAEYDSVVGGWLLEFAIELIHVRHLCWHSLGLIDGAGLLSIPVVFSFHDFYTVCPTIKLLDDKQHFCGGTCSDGLGECSVELWPQYAVPPLKHRFVKRWQEIMASALARCDAFVTTSPESRRIIADLYSKVAAKEITVIPHGRTFDRFRRLGRCPARGERVRILVPGNISVAKGAREILALRDRDVDGVFEFHILGAAPNVLAGANVVRHGTYAREDFARRCQEIAPHFGAIFSIWPETYSHTLTELWAVGIPVLAFDFGAVAERIRDDGGGWLLPHGRTDCVYGRMLSIVRDDSDYLSKVREIAAWQDGVGKLRTMSWMAGEYRALYERVQQTRLAFRSD